MSYPREGNFVGETAYLGFRFEGEQGTHYGYALFTDTFSKGTTILATAWESEPDTPIIAGAIPEPSSALLAIIGTLLGISRRKRVIA
ncbi:MAG: PEP-CTERM sorting domain-containing protein [Akkermansiaceae bacterium]